MLSLRGHTSSVRALAFSPDGLLLASAGDDAVVRFWDAGTGEALEVWDAFGSAVPCLAFGPDGAHLYAAGNDRVVRCWSAQEGALRPDLGRMPGGVVALAVSPGGGLVAAGSERAQRVPPASNLALFDALTRSDVCSLPRAAVEPTVWSLAFAPDGETLAVGRANGEVAFVRLHPESHRQSVLRHLATGVGVRALAYAPDGRTLVISPATPVLVYDTAQDAVRHRLGEPRYAFESLAFGPDGATLVTGCQDSTVRLWDVWSGVERARYDWQLGPIYAIAVSPDGMRAAAGGMTGEVVLFDIDL